MSYLAGGLDVLNAGASIRKFTAIGNGVKTVFSEIDFLESGFSYYTGINALSVFVDGVYQDKSEWIETSNNSITFAVAVTNLSKVEVRIVEAAKVTSAPTITDYRYTSDGTTSVINATMLQPTGFVYAINTRAVEIYFDGVRQANSEWAETAQDEITFNGIVPNGINVAIRVQSAIKLVDAIKADGGQMQNDPTTELGIATKRYVDTAPGRALQVVGKTIATQGVQTLQVGVLTQIGTGTDFEIDIIPKGNNSNFLIDFRWFGESSNAWDTAFHVLRDGVLLNTPSNFTPLSMATQTYGIAANNGSTPEILTLKTMDSSNTSIKNVAINFKFFVLNTGGTTLPTATVWTNRCFNGGGVSGLEAGISEIIITEIAA